MTKAGERRLNLALGLSIFAVALFAGYYVVLDRGPNESQVAAQGSNTERKYVQTGAEKARAVAGPRTKVTGPAAPEPEGTIEVVANFEDGRPVGDCEVWLADADRSDIRSLAWSEAGRTDASGRCTITQGTRWALPLAVLCRSGQFVGRRVVTENSVRVTLVPGVRQVVSVVDSAGSPVPGARVIVSRRSLMSAVDSVGSELGGLGAGSAIESRSGPGGIAVFEALPAGSFVCLVRKGGFVQEGLPTPFVAGESGVEVRLRPLAAAALDFAGDEVLSFQYHVGHVGMFSEFHQHELKLARALLERSHVGREIVVANSKEVPATVTVFFRHSGWRRIPITLSDFHDAIEQTIEAPDHTQDRSARVSLKIETPEARVEVPSVEVQLVGVQEPLGNLVVFKLQSGRAARVPNGEYQIRPNVLGWSSDTKVSVNGEDREIVLRCPQTVYAVDLKFEDENGFPIQEGVARVAGRSIGEKDVRFEGGGLALRVVDPVVRVAYIGNSERWDSVEVDVLRNDVVIVEGLR